MRPSELRNPDCPNCYLLAAWHGAAGASAFVDLGGRFIEVNQAWADMFGRSREDFPRLTWPEITVPEDVAADQHEVERLLRGEGPSFYELVKRYIGADGEPFPVLLRVAMVRRRCGEAWFFWVHATPLEELQRNERALIDAGFGEQVMARETARLASAGEKLGALLEQRGEEV